jgi:hypothetical protein
MDGMTSNQAGMDPGTQFASLGWGHILQQGGEIWMLRIIITIIVTGV